MAKISPGPALPNFLDPPQGLVTPSTTTDQASEEKPPPVLVSTATQTEPTLCTDKCRNAGATGNIRCIICMRWCQSAYCHEHADYEGTFTCLRCRTIPADFRQMLMILSDEVNNLSTDQTNNPTAYKEKKQQLRQLQAELPSHEEQPRVSVTSTPLPVHNRFDPLSRTFNISDESQDCFPSTDETNYSLPPNQQAWRKYRRKQKKKAAQKHVLITMKMHSK